MLKTETSSEFYWGIEEKCQPQKTTTHTHTQRTDKHLHKVVPVLGLKELLCNFEFDEYPFNPFKCAWKLKQHRPTMRCVNKRQTMRGAGLRWGRGAQGRIRSKVGENYKEKAGKDRQTKDECEQMLCNNQRKDKLRNKWRIKGILAVKHIRPGPRTKPEHFSFLPLSLSLCSCVSVFLFVPPPFTVSVRQLANCCPRAIQRCNEPGCLITESKP